MDQLQFLSEIGLGDRQDLRIPPTIPARARWVMPGSDADGISANARLDYDAEFGELEFGVYEYAYGETSYMSGRARIDEARGTVEVPDGAEALFERFCETVRLMALDEITVSLVEELME